MKPKGKGRGRKVNVGFFRKKKKIDVLVDNGIMSDVMGTTSTSRPHAISNDEDVEDEDGIEIDVEDDLFGYNISSQEATTSPQQSTSGQKRQNSITQGEMTVCFTTS